jgi:hypothetical protein
MAVGDLALNPQGSLTLSDWAKRLDPDGKVPKIVEMLTLTNEVLADMAWQEGNLPTGHRSTVRTGIPSVAWRKLNYGVPQGKSSTAQVDDTCGMLEAWSTVDKDLAILNGNTSEFRLSESFAFVEAMNQQMADTLFHGDTDKDPEKFLGLLPRFPKITGSGATVRNTLDAGGTTNLTDIWFAVWGPNTGFGIFPKGSTAGLTHEDMGLETVLDGASQPYRGYRDHYQWKAGLCIRDWRYFVRIANIDTAALKAGTGTQASTAATWVPNLMIKAMATVPALSVGRPVFYMNRTIKTYLQIQAFQKSLTAVRTDAALGQFQTSFDSIPMRTVDAITNAETQAT